VLSSLLGADRACGQERDPDRRIREGDRKPLLTSAIEGARLRFRPVLMTSPGVEYAMGFCTAKQHERFLQLCPEIEKYIVEGGIQLIKIWLEVGKEEQERRFLARINDPLRQWKLSPMDLESYRRWYDYSRARDLMFEKTDSDYAPWHIVPSDAKRRARLNCISHILSLIPYKKVASAEIELPKRSNKKKYDDRESLVERRIVALKY